MRFFKKLCVGSMALVLLVLFVPASHAQAANSNIGTVTINATLSESLTVTINSGAASHNPASPKHSGERNGHNYRRDDGLDAQARSHQRGGVGLFHQCWGGPSSPDGGEHDRHSFFGRENPGRRCGRV